MDKSSFNYLMFSSLCSSIEVISSHLKTYMHKFSLYFKILKYNSSLWNSDEMVIVSIIRP